MTVRFPDLPIFRGDARPCRFEGEIRDLEVEGDIPPSIEGAFFRVMLDHQYPPMRGSDILLNGDGNVAAYYFRDGHVDYRQRYVRTDRFRAERKARQSLFGDYRNPFTDDPRVAGLIRGTGNTNIVFYDGKLLALKEDSPPYAMNPLTLETVKLWDFGGTFRSETFTAHPKFDPLTGDMVCFGYEASGLGEPDIAYYEYDACGNLKHEAWFRTPYPGMVHDMVMTPNYVLFPIAPMVADLDQMKAGKPRFRFAPNLDQYFAVLPRGGTESDLRWFRGPCGLPGHTINAFESDGAIVFDSPMVAGNPFPWWPEAGNSAPPKGGFKSSIVRWVVDLQSSSDWIEPQEISPYLGELPIIDGRFAGQPYRHFYMPFKDPDFPYDAAKAGAPALGFLLNSLLHIDLANGKERKWHGGDTVALGEPVFIPRSTDAPEGDGHLIVPVHRHVEMTTELVILDAGQIDAGPVATVKVPLHHRPCVHGNWVPASKLYGLP